MATMMDVARMAGVSVATVSAALNGTAYVSPDLKKRVREAAKLLDYRVNVLARALKEGITDTVGMLIPDFALPDPFFTDVVRGAEITLRANDYSLLLGQTHNQLEEQSRHIRAFRSRLTDGLLLFQTPGDDPELRSFLDDDRPVVCVGRLPNGIEADVVATDIEAGTRMAVEHLISKGHRRIGLVMQKDSLSVRDFRVIGWRKAHSAKECQPAEDLQVEAPLSTSGGRHAMLQLLRRKVLPDAVFVDDLALAIGVVQALQEKGLAGKIEVLSSDDAEWLDVFQIPISTVVQPSHEVGVTAAQLLLKRLRNPRRKTETILLAPTLKIRSKGTLCR
jgi:LacI family transcriptional regulator